MDPKIDLAKLVGAASAPVALIIAACIYLGNLNQKYNSLFESIRQLAAELRQNPEGERHDSVHKQIELYEKRITGAMHCALLLNIGIILFALTVLFTGVSMLMPGYVPMMVATASVMALGIGIVVVAIVTELYFNRLARPTLDTELSSGTPQYKPVHAQSNGD